MTAATTVESTAPENAFSVYRVRVLRSTHTLSACAYSDLIFVDGRVETGASSTRTYTLRSSSKYRRYSSK